jgi:hypothetical protein
MRAKILDRWTTFCAVYVCSCGSRISGCYDHGGNQPSYVVQHGCHRCHDRWLAKRIEKAETEGWGRKIAHDLRVFCIENNDIYDHP